MWLKEIKRIQNWLTELENDWNMRKVTEGNLKIIKDGWKELNKADIGWMRLKGKRKRLTLMQRIKVSEMNKKEERGNISKKENKTMIWVEPLK